MSDDSLRMIFTKNLNYYMEKAEKSQTDLYKYLNVSSATASDWCNGRKMPRADKIQSIANWLNVSIGDLMEEKSETLSDESAIISIKVAKSPELKRLIAYYEALSESGRKTIMNNIISLQSDGDKNSERVLAYYNALNPKGKQRVMENAEEMLQLYPKEEEENE